MPLDLQLFAPLANLLCRRPPITSGTFGHRSASPNTQANGARAYRGNEIVYACVEMLATSAVIAVGAAVIVEFPALAAASRKVAVTFLSASIVTVAGLVLPMRSTVQPLKTHPGSATAVRATIVP